MPDPTTAEQLTAVVFQAKDKASRGRRLERLASRVRTRPVVLPVFRRLLEPPGGPRVALEFVARMRAPVPNGLLLLSAPLLQDRKVPAPIRVAAAAKLLRSLPDRPESVGPVVRSLTAGMGPGPAAERLIELQAKVPGSVTLPPLVAEAASKVRLRCPKCNERFDRTVFEEHLWTKHRLVFDHGQARDPGKVVERAVVRYQNDRRPDHLDRVYELSEKFFPGVDPAQVHQAVLSRVGASPDDLEPLLKAAAENDAGLCPNCFASIRDRLAPPPQALALSDGRLVGEGYVVQVGRGLIRTARVWRPGRDPETVADPSARLGPRQAGVRFVAPVAAVGAVAALLPLPRVQPILAALVGAVAAVLVYGAVRMTRSRGASRDTRAIDTAWAAVVPEVGRSGPAVRFLTRLCRTSLGRGDPYGRSDILRELVENAAVLSEKGGPYLPFLAAVRLLESHDAARLGKDWVPQLLPLFEPFVRAELPAEYVEAAADMLLGTDVFTDQPAARLRVALTAAAFDAGLVPADLIELEKLLPRFPRLLAGTADWFQLLHEVWRLRSTRPWDSISAAQTVFEFAKKSPAASGRVLVSYPDTLVVADFDAPFDRELGAILIGRRGVTVMERTVSDPNAPVSVETTRNGTGVLLFGPHTLAVRRKLPERLAKQLSAWLRFRVDRLILPADKPLPSPGERVRQMAGRLAVECPLCRGRCVIRTGQLGIPVH